MRNPGNDEVIHVDYVEHGPVLRNLGDDTWIYKKHGPVAKNLEDVDVIHVDFRETLSGREKPRGRRSSSRGLRET